MKENDYQITTPEAWYVIKALAVRLNRLKQEERWLERNRERLVSEKGERIFYHRARRNKGKMINTCKILEHMREHFNIPIEAKSNKITVEQ